jgi:putative transposase
MIDREHDLPLGRQAELLRLSRSTLYYEPRPVPAADLVIMRRIDALHLDYPFAGSRMLRDLLRGEGVAVGRERVTTMMRCMGIEALYCKPNTSRSAPGHKIYPYLLRDLAVERPNQVWAMDITYIPMARGFVYLAAVVDWFSRRVLAWRLSITMEVDFCLDAVEAVPPDPAELGLRGGCAGHDLISLAAEVHRPDAGVLPLGCGLPRPGQAGARKARSGTAATRRPVLHGRGEHGEDPPFRDDRRPA